MPPIDPTRESFRALFSHTTPDQPVVMLNLLRFRAQAQYAPEHPESPCSGREAYARYSAQALPAVSAAGGQVLWQGRVCHALVAPSDERWDAMLLVQYPSATAFMDMVRHPHYQSFAHHRSAALEEARLIALQS